jgi:hypothetical protein
METNQNKKSIFLAVGLIIMAALSRFIPHPPNFTPIMAMAIFGPVLFKDKRLAFTVPLLAMFLTDLVIGLHSTMIFVYVSFLIGVLLGFTLINRLKPIRLALTSLFASVIFFLITNFGSWLTSGIYPKSIDGLFQAYFFGLPFFRYTPLEMFGFSVLSNLIYSFVIYGVIVLAEKTSPQYSFK